MRFTLVCTACMVLCAMALCAVSGVVAAETSNSQKFTQNIDIKDVKAFFDDAAANPKKCDNPWAQGPGCGEKSVNTNSGTATSGTTKDVGQSAANSATTDSQTIESVFGSSMFGTDASSADINFTFTFTITDTGQETELISGYYEASLEEILYTLFYELFYELFAAIELGEMDFGDDFNDIFSDMQSYQIESILYDLYDAAEAGDEEAVVLALERLESVVAETEVYSALFENTADMEDLFQWLMSDYETEIFEIQPADEIISEKRSDTIISDVDEISVSLDTVLHDIGAKSRRVTTITTALSDAMNAKSEADYGASLKEAYNSAWNAIGINARITGNGEPVWDAISHTAHALYSIRIAVEAGDKVSLAGALEELKSGIASFEEIERMYRTPYFGELVSALKKSQVQWENYL